ncbi:MAG TPA: PTS glucitol/sorbitol transporter subunit IIA [Trichococcus sp.]|nr:PTS glucitol/sorbitol transporter subunit IIA [Trichococcus sp.]
MQSKVIQIGEKAIDIKEPMIILFDDSATPPLQEVSVIHRFVEPQEWFELEDGDRILFDDQEYRISYVGTHVLKNLKSIGHTTMIFNNWDDERLETSIYLTPYILPTITDGTTITYKKKD